MDQKSLRVGFVLVGCLGLPVMLVTGVVIGIWLARNGGVQATFQPEAAVAGVPASTRPVESPLGVDDWTHVELIAFLRKKGLVFHTAKVGRPRPTMLLDKDADGINGRASVLDEGNIMQVLQDAVVVEIITNPKFAKERWGTMPEKSFVYGKFFFVGDEKMIAEIAAAVKK